MGGGMFKGIFGQSMDFTSDYLDRKSNERMYNKYASSQQALGKLQADTARSIAKSRNKTDLEIGKSHDQTQISLGQLETAAAKFMGRMQLGGQIGSDLFSYYGKQDENNARLKVAQLQAGNNVNLAKMQNALNINAMKLQNYNELTKQANQFVFESNIYDTQARNAHQMEQDLLAHESQGWMAQQAAARDKYKFDYSRSLMQAKTARHLADKQADVLQQKAWMENNAFKYESAGDTLVRSREVDQKNQVLRYLESGKETGFSSEETQALSNQLESLAKSNWQPVNNITEKRNALNLHEAQIKASMVDILKKGKNHFNLIGKTSKETADLQKQQLELGQKQPPPKRPLPPDEEAQLKFDPIYEPTPPPKSEPFQVKYEPPLIKKPKLSTPDVTPTTVTPSSTKSAADIVKEINKVEDAVIPQPSPNK